ncbi:glycerol-3-phosphate dehydrogenase [Microbacterium terrae]|uniref:Glycerol-3-phosphate dehydrogenase n=1 Tax=Microbacterium terrae TaxID=69369 RepID=A0A0M2HFQ8_9MICO|nr:glycerol-3-phosphate dehydrogenase/oxidase [Microbacterium terrae]KJL43536.1 Aerobic glycerol-3-phosphate dehydrogenase [Microbacterium terrae]MBP1077916.1 glycerol-3-phosphate dehydrogenase [Microbacterium terrae]GLK00088.1 glycerol-3-phosphate dehydrogenase [Microbacterium terrae]
MIERGRTPHPTALSARRRERELEQLAEASEIDVLVIGGGITGVGTALDAASRGLRTALVERHDLAHGTSRWSSKLVHGGLRYLASGQFAIAHESAAERHLLMTRLAPHLIRPLAQIVPLFEPDHRAQGAVTGAGYALGDGLRRVVGTPGALLPSPAVISATEALRLAPALRRAGLRSAVRGWDGQLIDDARLVLAVARTAAGYGASVLTRVEAVSAAGDRARLRDRITGEEFVVRARAVVNATGVWAGGLDREVRLRPSRGTHLVVSSGVLGGSDVSLTVPVPGTTSRFVFTLPAMHGRTYIGLTDVDAGAAIPDVPLASDAEIDELLAVVNTALGRALTRDDVLATYAGLRPLGAGDDAESSDLSRRHIVTVADSGLVSIIGGKLTTYRRMAEDTVDVVVRERLAPRGTPPSSTRHVPLVGAWPRERLDEIAAPSRLVRRYGAEAPYAASLADGPGAVYGVTAQELEWGVRVEGALSVDDLLHRRTRLGLVAADAEASTDAAVAAFARAGVSPR